MKKVRVLIVEDSFFFRKFLVDGLSKYQNIEIVGMAANALEAGQKVKLLRPDVVTLDIEMPGMSGLEFLNKLLFTQPVPVIIVSSLNLKLFDALLAGAVDFVKKPESAAKGSSEIFISSLSSKLIVASRAHVRPPAPCGHEMETRQRTTPSGRGTAPEGQRAAPGGQGTALGMRSTALEGQGMAIPLSRWNLSHSKPTSVIAVGASTGGTEAILNVLKPLPKNLPPMVITQHMPSGFTQMYANRLNRLTSIEVREAKNGDVLSSGLALIAPGGLQMKLLKGPLGYFVSCYSGQPVHGLAPSVDVLFDSVAECAGKDAIGIILTGMGRDGADGLLHMKEKGAYTIGQDKESCVVYGMPMEAYEAGAICRQASLENIPAVLMNYLARSS